MNFLNTKQKQQSDKQSIEHSVVSETINISNHLKKKEGFVISKQFLVKERLYKGTYYNTYKGVNIVSQDKEGVIIRLTNQNTDNIKNEMRTLKMLQHVQQVPQTLHTTELRQGSNQYQVQVFEQKGPNLKMTFHLLQKKFSLQTICLIGIKLLDALEKIHSANIVHRNLRLRKIMTSQYIDNTTLYILDFKNSKKFKHSNGKHVKYTNTEGLRHQNKEFLNKFSSLGTHLGIPPSQKDDLESLFYIIFYLIRKGQIWGDKSNLKKEEKLKYYEEQKLRLLPEELSKQKIPLEIINAYNYVRLLPIETNATKEKSIDYNLIRQQFIQVLKNNNININQIEYDWVKIISQVVKNPRDKTNNQTELQTESEKKNSISSGKEDSGKSKNKLGFFNKKKEQNQENESQKSKKSQQSQNKSSNSNIEKQNSIEEIINNDNDDDDIDNQNLQNGENTQRKQSQATINSQNQQNFSKNQIQSNKNLSQKNLNNENGQQQINETQNNNNSNQNLENGDQSNKNLDNENNKQLSQQDLDNNKNVKSNKNLENSNNNNEKSNQNLDQDYDNELCLTDGSEYVQDEFTCEDLDQYSKSNYINMKKINVIKKYQEVDGQYLTFSQRQEVCKDVSVISMTKKPPEPKQEGLTLLEQLNAQ